jgi:5-formyltetrahydrofolate cyclo-ligase
MVAMTAADQSVIRAAIRRVRAARSTAQRQVDSAAITQRFESLPESQDAQCVAIYASLDTEPDTWSLIHQFQATGRTILLPRVSGPRTLEWGRYDGPDSLVAGKWNILEPKEPTTASLCESEIIVVPALAVDPTTGLRMGYGGGYFDAALAVVPLHTDGGPLRVALCFDDEVIEGLPANKWDARVDVLVTPTRTLRP